MLGHYLMFNRNCAEALAVYEKAFGGKIGEIQRYGDMPDGSGFHVSEADKGLVLHARLALDDGELMCADGTDCEAVGDNMYVSISFKDEGQAQIAWDMLKQGGEVFNELTPAFFAALHGSLRDRFGINWMFTVMK